MFILMMLDIPDVFWWKNQLVHGEEEVVEHCLPETMDVVCCLPDMR